MLQAGLSVSVSTDNRLMSGVSLSSELRALHEVIGLPLAGIGQLNRAAAEASFMPRAVREAALGTIAAS
jgi:adenosine deaminase